MYYVLINFVTLMVFRADKIRAGKHFWRIPEKWLMALGLIGGCAGRTYWDAHV
ncbi:DUF1294 domain-containing protein [Arcanobacterium phocae]|uniref:DUF1294 domain-containing protein n=1 Tax=Arcanobacterium phocae TaxID=131112 RepID=UPI00344C5CB4